MIGGLAMSYSSGLTIFALCGVVMAGSYAMSNLPAQTEPHVQVNATQQANTVRQVNAAAETLPLRGEQLPIRGCRTEQGCAAGPVSRLASLGNEAVSLALGSAVQCITGATAWLNRSAGTKRNMPF